MNALNAIYRSCHGIVSFINALINITLPNSAMIFWISNVNADKLNEVVMCGRLNIIDDPLCKIVSQSLGIHFSTPSNNDLCPSENVASIINSKAGPIQHNASWGIQPSWAKRLLINAQSETVMTKPTFAQAFAQSRCLIPCSGWYEWRTEAGKKQKYLFSHQAQQPFYMAGILFNHLPSQTQLVTLTTSPNEKCAQYHKRMPVLISPEHIDYWFNSEAAKLTPLMHAIDSKLICVNQA
jgi:putative SOS response-associated peptidase YedK